MKKLLFIIGLFGMVSLYGQGIYFQTDAGIGGALSFGDLKSYGIAAFAEPKLFIMPSLAVGIRFEGAVMFAGSIPDDAEDLEVGLTTRAAILPKGEYYLGKGKTRPYAGLGMGMYTKGDITATGTGDASITAGRSFGVAPEIGISFGGFRISGIYHIVTGKDILTMDVGDTRELSRNYLVIQLSFRTFTIGLEE